MSLPLRILLAWAIDAASLAVAAWIFSGISVGGSAGTLIVSALVYGILATFVKPILKLLTFPLMLLTLGIMWFLVAMFILWLTDVIVPGLTINGFWTLVGGTIVVWLVGAIADHYLFPKRGPLERLRARLSGNQRPSMRSASVVCVRDAMPPGRPRLNLSQ